MIKQFRYFLKLLIFLLLFFALWRLIFLATNVWSHKGGSRIASLGSLLYGIRMDLSVIGYLFAPLALLWLLEIGAISKWIRGLRIAFILIYISCCTLVLMGNAIIYHFWGLMLNYRALTYLSDPKEVLINLDWLQGLVIVVALGILISLPIWVLRRVVPEFSDPSAVSFKQRLLAFILLVPLSVLGIRGGLQKNPMNESLIYFSDELSFNVAAVNPIWHLAYDTGTALSHTGNPFTTMEKDRAAAILSNFNRPSTNDSGNILKVPRPNIVFILMESFTADVVGALGGEKGVAPFLDSLIAKGLLFDSIYSSGFRTDQGIVSVLNGWPATPFHSIMRSTDKCVRQPSFCREVKSLGYHTSYYYGGASNFSNLNAYLRTQGFDHSYSEDDFSNEAVHGQWGVHDDAVLQRQATDLDRLQQPFFSMVMTLSNHEPFDVPGPKAYTGSTAADKFRNAAHYADASLRHYFEVVRSKPWYPNTLFVLVADHAHELPLNRNILFPNGRHIPLLFFGPALADSLIGERSHTIGGHHDLPATLLKQLGLNSAPFKWSKDLLAADAKSFAYLPLENYLTWVYPKGWFVWMVAGRTISHHAEGLNVKNGDPEVLFARAFFQQHYADFQNY